MRLEYRLDSVVLHAETQVEAQILQQWSDKVPMWSGWCWECDRRWGAPASATVGFRVKSPGELRRIKWTSLRYRFKAWLRRLRSIRVRVGVPDEN